MYVYLNIYIPPALPHLPFIINQVHFPMCPGTHEPTGALQCSFEAGGNFGAQLDSESPLKGDGIPNKRKVLIFQTSFVQELCLYNIYDFPGEVRPSKKKDGIRCRQNLREAIVQTLFGY